MIWNYNQASGEEEKKQTPPCKSEIQGYSQVWAHIKIREAMSGEYIACDRARIHISCRLGGEIAIE